MNKFNTILVTGCAGFIGSTLSELLLSSGYNVVGLDILDAFYDEKYKRENIEGLLKNDRFKFYEIDINQIDQIQEDISVVVHLAAKAGVRSSIEYPDKYIDANIQGTNSVLNFMVDRKIKKMVFASSSSVYGNCKENSFTEDLNVDKQISPYAFTKKSCELMNYTYHNLYGLDILNLRFFTVYGERQRPDLAIYKFTKAILNGEAIIQYGDGNSGRDYTHVKDVCSGIQKSIDYLVQNEGVYDTLNIGNHYPIKLNQLIEAIFRIIGKEKNVKVEPMQMGDVDLTCANIDKARSLINYEPKISFEEGIRNFVKWFKENRL